MRPYIIYAPVHLCALTDLLPIRINLTLEIPIAVFNTTVKAIASFPSN
ncbi:hypothetical protein H6G17_11705 [Chroococcidiopsis sp. FACHB-1243]|nr:hypothetical protein [Chroococcidiopsis sp. [FACHB-1243]]MBD2306178.1 hypothetical protein [Chroococcidiopsis sp. [FACHB-1243]]